VASMRCASNSPMGGDAGADLGFLPLPSVEAGAIAFFQSQVLGGDHQEIICAGVSEGVVMKILGHKTGFHPLRTYNSKNEADLREAAEAIAATVPGQAGRTVGLETGRTGTGHAEVVAIAPPAKKP
jgi:hypothetical protein